MYQQAQAIEEKHETSQRGGESREGLSADLADHQHMMDRLKELLEQAAAGDEKARAALMEAIR